MSKYSVSSTMLMPTIFTVMTRQTASFSEFQDVAGHVAREEEADDRQRVGLARRLFVIGEDLRDGVQARQEHEAEEQVDEERNAERL